MCGRWRRYTFGEMKKQKVLEAKEKENGNNC